jgi:hypothetical protein
MEGQVLYRAVEPMIIIIIIIIIMNTNETEMSDLHANNTYKKATNEKQGDNYKISVSIFCLHSRNTLPTVILI